MSRASLLILLLLTVPAARGQSPEPTPTTRFEVRANVAPAPTPTSRFAVTAASVAPVETPAATRFSIKTVSAKGGACIGAADGTIFRNGFEN